MRTTRMERGIQISSLAVVVCAAIVLAQDHPGSPGDPGYDWGRDNCGPHTAGLRSLEECYACCTNEDATNVHPQNWLDQCKGYCDSVNWEAWGGE